MSAAALCRLDNPFSGLVENAMVISLEADADLLLGHYSPIQ
jgi:hypothetical protein